MNKPKYAYDLNGMWNVYQMEYIGTSSYGHKVSEWNTKEEARKETYRLNGWIYTPKNEIRT